jgi:hypothetical protein
MLEPLKRSAFKHFHQIHRRSSLMIIELGIVTDVTQFDSPPEDFDHIVYSLAP